MTEQTPTIHTIFPSPVYIIRRELDLDSTEEKDIEDIVKEGMNINEGNLSSRNSYIFNGKLKKIKQFCEQHIKIYVKEILDPEEELDFYITQSWLNVVEPGGSIHKHLHENSIISGAYYVSTVENDRIVFDDPNEFRKAAINIEPKEYHLFNSSTWFFPINNNLLLLFPSWLEHAVEPNEKVTTDRISISFNTFMIGTIGKKDDLNVINLPDPR